MQEPGESILVKVKQFHHVITSIGKAPAEWALSGAVPATVGGGLGERPVDGIWGCSKQGQTVKMEAEPSTDAIGDDTATTGLTSCSPFYFFPSN